MGKMKKLYPYNKNFVKNVELLENGKLKDMNLIGWKRSRGDGNCYFRAVIYKHFDNIHKVYSPVSMLTKFKSVLIVHRIENLNYKNFSDSKEYQQARDYILSYLDYAIKLKESGDYIETYTNFLEKMQNEEFDINLVRVSRLIAASNLYMLKDTDDYFPYMYDGYEPILDDILTMGKEGEGLALMILPVTLDTQVKQLMYLEKENIIIEKFPSECDSSKGSISIIRRSGHYDILCTKQEMELEGLNIEQGTYHFCKNISYYNLFKIDS